MSAGDWGALTALVRALLFMEMFIRAMAPHVKRELSFEEARGARAHGRARQRGESQSRLAAIGTMLKRAGLLQRRALGDPGAINGETPGGAESATLPSALKPSVRAGISGDLRARRSGRLHDMSQAGTGRGANEKGSACTAPPLATARPRPLSFAERRPRRPLLSCRAARSPNTRHRSRRRRIASAPRHGADL